MLCVLAVSHGRFGTTCQPHLQWSSALGIGIYRRFGTNCRSYPTTAKIPFTSRQKLEIAIRILHEKLIVSKPFKKFYAFYGIRWYITEFTTAHHLSLLFFSK